MIMTGTHHFGDARQRWGHDRSGPVVIGDGGWIGARVTVLPGVTIADGCVVGTGALVREDCEPDGIYVGVPARRARDLPRSGPIGSERT